MLRSQRLLNMPGHLVRKLNQHSAAVFSDELRQAGFDVTPMQFAAMMILADHPGIDQTGLAQKIAADRATIGSMLKRLEEKSYIQRLPHAEDRRAISLHLTGQGLALVDQLEPLVSGLQSKILTRLSPQETELFQKLIQKILG